MTDERPEAFRLLFVCTGNTCRSPTAELLARDEAERRGWTHLEVSSAGIAALPGMPASDGARDAARRRGLDLDAHRSRPLSTDLLESADLILVMSQGHLARVAELGGAGRAALLGAFAREGGEDGPLSVPDPFGGDRRAYEETFDTLQDLVARAMARLEPILAP